MQYCRSSENDTARTLTQCWEVRKSWWPRYHFRPQSVESERADTELLAAKARVAVVLLGKGERVCSKFCDERDEGLEAGVKTLPML